MRQKGMMTMSEHAAGVARYYDKVTAQPAPYEAEFRGPCEYVNLGYWTPMTQTPDEAGDNLVQAMLDLLPSTQGSILDVACGKGATTRYISKFFDPKNITGINISKEHLRRCAVNAPGCNFLEMDATNLEFPAETFDNVFCCEAAFHFDTREAFLKEAYRVLKVGGTLVVADVLMAKAPQMPRFRHVQPAGNNITLPEYTPLCQRAGFKSVKIVDVTDECLGGFAEAIKRMLDRKFQAGQLRPIQYFPAVLYYHGLKKAFRTKTWYILAAMTKD